MRRMLKLSGGLSWGLSWRLIFLLGAGIVLGRVGGPAIAAEYQGKNIDGRKFPAQAYLYETGGVFEVEVEFKQNRATLYFANGSRQTLRLNQAVITDPARIEGWGMPFNFQVGGFLRLGIVQSDLGNLQPSRQLEGRWQIRIKGKDWP
jgi:hypothetical protein